MKKILFLLLLPAFCHAQNCYTKKDEFSGKVTKSASTPLMGTLLMMGPTVTVAKRDSAYLFEYSLSVALAANNFSITKMYVALKFADGTIKKFSPNSETKIVEGGVAGNGVIVAFVSDINAEDMKYIFTHPLAIVRISYLGDDNSVYDVKVSEGKAKKIMASSNCLD